jgi:hypothetical protein
MLKSWWWLPVLACASACGSATKPGPDGDGPGLAEVELGQGELEFSPLSEDEALPYAAGAQGGHHVFVSFRVRQLRPSRMHVSVTTAIEGRPDRVLTREGRVNFAPAPADTDESDAAERFDFAGWPAQILFAPCHPGEAVRIDVILTDLDMRSASDSRTIRIAAPQGAPEPNCPAP